MIKTPWEKVTFRSRRFYWPIENSFIMPRECIVGKDQNNLNAFESIREWVQEQAITMDQGFINSIAQELLSMWQRIPQPYNYIVFTLVSTTGDLFYCLVREENAEGRIRLQNHRPRSIKECKVVKNSVMTKSVARTQIRAWVNALGLFYYTNMVKAMSEDLLLVWESLPNNHYIVFKFVVPTRNFVFSIGTILTE